MWQNVAFLVGDWLLARVKVSCFVRSMGGRGRPKRMVDVGSVVVGHGDGRCQDNGMGL